MQNRYQRWLLAMVVLFAAPVGIAKQALAQTFTEFPAPTAGSLPQGITTAEELASIPEAKVTDRRHAAYQFGGVRGMGRHGRLYYGPLPRCRPPPGTAAYRG